MLIPRFSIRWLLGLTTFSAGVSLVLSYAVQGHAWAVGVTSGLWTFVVIGVLYAIAFLGAWFISQWNASPQRHSGVSPFASAKSDTALAKAQSAADTPPPMTG